MASLYIVATPIGNLQDITLRAIKTLFEVNYILAENSQKTSQLLSKLKNEPELFKKSKIPKIISFNEYEETIKIPDVISLIEKGNNVALVSCAGTPLISDPGYKLVREVFNRGIKVIPIPGPSSVIAALSASTLPTDKFLFLGFLPRSNSKMKTSLKSLKGILSTMEDCKMMPTVVIFESPYRIVKLLQELFVIFGDIEIVLGREITKIFEKIEVNKISNFLNDYSNKKPKGEYILLLNLKKS